MNILMRMIIANIAIVITPNKNNALLLLKTSFISTNDIFKSSCVTSSFNGENPNKNPVITDAKIYNTRHTSKALSIVPIILIGKTLYEKTVTDNLAISNIIKINDSAITIALVFSLFFFIIM